MHCVYITPHERDLIAVDLGIDALKADPIDPATGSAIITTIKNGAWFWSSPDNVVFESDERESPTL
jgi:hypothetical protein